MARTPRPHQDARVGLRSTFRSLLDDRGRRIRRIRRADLVRAARSDSPGLAMLAARLRTAVRSEARRNTPDRVVLMIALVLGVLVLWGVLNALAVSVFGVGGLFISLFILIGLVVSANRVHYWYVRRGALSQIARTAVAEGVCGSCAFPLEGAPAEPDATLVCPECGAAWRADRVVSPFWERPVVPVLRRGVLPLLTPGVRSRQALYAPDDRGRYVQTPDSRLMRVRPELLAEVPPDEQRAIRRDARRVGRWWRVLLTAVMGALPAFILWLAWLARSEDEMVLAWIFAATGGLVMIGVLGIPMGSAFGGPHATARVMVRHGRCGSCLHPLGAAPPDAGGRRVCPRCGAGWVTDQEPAPDDDLLSPRRAP
jgi:predicted RNA-binding Zn-ribbon protein involved in translation (DUF1610 family)